MSVQIFDDVVQGTDEWRQLRCGLPTASRFADVIAKKGPRGGIPKGRQTYMRKLAGEALTGEPMDNYTNGHMERGHEREAEARDLYAFIKDAEPVQVGFIKNGTCGCSPDALVGEVGLLEIKDALPHIQIERLEAGGLPAEHKAQCQGQLLVSERKWVDFMSHSRGLPPLIVRVERDEEYLEEMRQLVDTFLGELNQLVEKIKGM